MIPFVRVTTFIFFMVLVLCTVYEGFASTVHPFMGLNVMLWAMLSAFLIFAASLFRNFVTDLIAVLWTGYVTQRIIVIYIWPQEIDYQGWLMFDNDLMLRTVVFIFFSAFALMCGTLFTALSLKKKSSSHLFNSSENCEENFTYPINLYGKIIPFERFVTIVSWVIIVGIFFKIYVLVVVGIGFTGQTYERESAALLRLSDMPFSLGFILFLAIVAYWQNLRYYKTIFVVFLLMILSSVFLSASKGALVGAATSLLIALYLIRRSIPKKIVAYGLLVFLFTALLLGGLMTQWRNVLLDHQAVSLVFSSESFIEPAAKALLAFSQRMGGFDWLAGIMNVGRDSFYPSANLWIDLRALINSFIPGGIINPADDYVEISKLLPHLLRGSGLDIRLGGHGELMGGLGMAYIYFGELFGPLFFFFWVWGCIAFIKSSMHVVVKMFMIHFFLLVTFIGGGFSTMFFHMANIFYLSLLLYVLDLVSFPFFQSMCHVKGQGSSQL